MKNALRRTYFFSTIRSYFNKGNDRSVKAKKNIFLLVFIKFTSISISLLLVPLTIHYVNPESYGIWLTVSSLVIWFSFFDIGLTNGMRNKFAESVANGDDKTARSYISTTYFSLVLIAFTLWIIFLLINKYLDWCSLLKIERNIETEVRTLVLIICSYFCFQFVLKIINTILIASQQPAIAGFIDLIGQLLSLLIIFILTKTTEGSLVNLGIGLTAAPICVLLIANIILFHSKYKIYAPSFSYFRIKYLRELFGLSSKFFIIQIAALIQYQTANFIIARFFNMESVTNYNITYKYFNILLMGFSILLAPFWSASTDAFARKDYSWIKKTIKKYQYTFCLFSIAGILMLIVSSFIYDLWIGQGVVFISFSMSFWAFIYVMATMYGSIYVNLLNGIGAVKIQSYCSMVTPFLFIFLCWIFIKNLHMGVYCLFIASIFSNLNGIIIAPLQYRKIFIENKAGIWKM